MASNHPALSAFIENHERESAKQFRYRRTIGHAERMCLEEVIGPALQYNFEGLRAEFPFKDFKGGDRFVDFVYVRGGIKLIIEVDGFHTHAKDITSAEFDDHLSRQNDLILQGWLILRFSANQVERQPMVCRRQLMQAIGYWWTITLGNFQPGDRSMWESRKRAVIHIASRQGGEIRCRDVAKHFAIHRKTAHEWLQRFVEDKVLLPQLSKQRITSYRLKQPQPEL